MLAEEKEKEREARATRGRDFMKSTGVLNKWKQAQDKEKHEMEQKRLADKLKRLEDDVFKACRRGMARVATERAIEKEKEKEEEEVEVAVVEEEVDEEAAGVQVELEEQLEQEAFIIEHKGEDERRRRVESKKNTAMVTSASPKPRSPVPTAASPSVVRKSGPRKKAGASPAGERAQALIDRMSALTSNLSRMSDAVESTSRRTGKQKSQQSGRASLGGGGGARGASPSNVSPPAAVTCEFDHMLMAEGSKRRKSLDDLVLDDEIRKLIVRSVS
jgi:hypothetical protein